MRYPLDKYKFVEHDGVNKENRPVHEVIAISTYAGRTVRGVAQCDQRDTFNLENGKRLAAARCNHKIAIKRTKRAEKKMLEAQQKLESAKRYLERMNQYYTDSMDAEAEAEKNIKMLLQEM